MIFSDDRGTIGRDALTVIRKCTEDARRLMWLASEGEWMVSERCMIDEGKLCEKGACVDPWDHGSPVYEDCTDDPHAHGDESGRKAAK